MGVEGAIISIVGAIISIVTRSKYYASHNLFYGDRKGGTGPPITNSVFADLYIPHGFYVVGAHG